MNISKFLFLGTLVAGIFLTMTQPASATEYDIRGIVGLTPIPTAEGTAMVEEFTTEGSTGTGTFKPFLQVNQLGGHPKSPVYGFSTDLALSYSVAFYTTEPTYAPTLAELPIVEVGGIKYIEFVCDNNQNKNAEGRQLSFDELKIYQTNNNMINYTELSGLTPIWNLDNPTDSWIHLNAQFGSGSGSGDLRILIPYSLFSHSFTHVVAWVSFGGYNPTPGNDAAAVESAHPNNDGFEEFGYLLYPGVADVSITKSADIDEFCLDQAPYPVTYTYLVENTGTDDLTDVVVTDDICGPVSGPTGDDGDGLLNPGEIWTYECSTDLDSATTNTGTVVAVGVESGTEVTDSDTAFVDVVEVAVTIDPAAAEICEGDAPVELCAVASLGTGNYSYLWSTGETTACIEVDEAGIYSVTVTDDITGCQDTAEAELSVISVPVCSILGPDEVCADDIGILYESEYSADTYHWTISGDGEIDGADNGPTVLVNATGVGGFTLTLEVCNEGDVIECCDSCFLNVTTLPCAPGIQIDKYTDIDMFCLSDDVPVPVTYSYDVYTTGDEALVDVDVYDDTCGPLTRLADDPGNDDDILEIGEIWVFECSTDLYGTTTNTVAADGYGIFSDEYVYDEDTATVTAYDVAVDVTPAESEICLGGEPVELTANVTLGSGNYSYLWSTGETTQSIFVDEAGEYCVTVTDIDTGCVAEDCATLAVVDIPDCTIEGPDSLCVGDQVQFCATVSDAYSYVWVIALGSEYAEIVGDDTGNCVTIHATGEGTFRLALNICYAGDVVVCCDECSVDVPVEPCGGAFCTLTQGFYGNKGGKACGLKTADLIDALLAYGDVVVGGTGHSITLGTSDCIIDLLPAGGTADVLPAGDFDCNDSSNTIPDSILVQFSKKEFRFNNVLIGQIVALTLNLRLYNIDCVGEGGTGNLAAWELPAEFCTMGKDGCAKKHITPEAFVGMDVATILALANDVIAGEDVGLSPSEINGVVDFINEAFDGCKEIVTCPTVEICDNGCDDDFDGAVDCDDSDCTEDPACIVIEPTI